MKKLCVVLGAAALFLARPAAGDTLTQPISGVCESGEPVSALVTIDFTPTGGDFNLGTGTATVVVTLANTSPLEPFQTPAIGNAVLTGFLFNIPTGAGAALAEVRIPAGSALVSTGTTMFGVEIPAGCIDLAFDLVRTQWYELLAGAASGQYGIFTTSFEPLNGIKAGLVNASVYPSCVAQGDVFSPLFISGPIQFTLDLSALDNTLTSAQDFLELCSLTPGGQTPSAFAAKFQGTGSGGEESCFIGETGQCTPVPAENTTWGVIKSLFE